MNMKLALVDTAPRATPAETVAAGLEIAAPAVATGARLVVFPELFPYLAFPAVHDKGVMFTVAEVFPYPSVEAARAFARAHGAWVVMPAFIQRGENTCYNAAFLIDSQGEIAAEHRQRHVREGDGWRGQLYFSPGEGAPAVVTIGERRVGLALGHDLYDPGIMADLARAGADLVIVPAHVVDPRHQEEIEVLARGAAITHGLDMVLCTRNGQHLLIGTDGRVAAREPAGDEAVVRDVPAASSPRRFRGWGARPATMPPAAPTEAIRRVSYAWSPLLLDHETNQEPGRYEIPERPERLRHVLDLLQQVGILDTLKCVRPRPASEEELALAHDPAYIDGIHRHAEAGLGFHGLYSPFGTGSYDVARMAVGAVIEAAASTLAGGYHRSPVSMALVRPPGHHAETHRGMGYCLFNNVAVTARWLQAHRTTIHPAIERVMIIDWDVHHGNGTQQIFYDDPSVLVCSLHQAHEYPGTGAVDEIGRGDGAGYTINLPLPAGSGDVSYRRVFTEVIQPVAGQFRPDIVLVSAGQDCHHADPLSDMRVTVEGFRAMARSAQEIANQFCDGRLVVALEGGYNLHTLPFLVLAILDEIGDLGFEVAEPIPLEPGPEPPAAAEVIAQVQKALSAYWRF